jgi:hypothetical protein
MKQIENDGEKFSGPGGGGALVKKGVAAIGYLSGGVLIFVMNILGGKFRPFGIILGLAAAALGLISLTDSNPDEKKPGAILATAGICELIVHFGIPVLKPIAISILGIGAFGLFALGIVRGIQFLFGLRSLSK